MENLDLGWELGVIFLLLFLIAYYLIATVNYLLVVFLGEQLRKLFEARNFKNKNTILDTALPLLISSAVIYFIVIKPSIFFLCETQNGDDIMENSLFSEPFYHYITDFMGYIVGLTCLSLTRYSFTKDWKVIGRLKNKRTIFNFILWTTMVFFIKFISDMIEFYFIPYCTLITLATYLFLKRRNVNKTIKEQISEINSD